MVCYITTAHTCKFPGCSNVLVLDDHIKNRRDVCLAKDAGYIEYPTLPGHIKTGCMASPHFKSRYCKSHTPRACSSDEAGMFSKNSQVYTTEH